MNEPADPPAAIAGRSAAPYDLRPRRWPALAFWVAVAAAVGWLWHRSYVVSDVYAAYTRSATIQGVLSHRGELLLAVTSIPLNPEWALTTDHWSCPAAEADELFLAAYTLAPAGEHWWVGGYGRGPPGTFADLPTASWTAVAVPHWLPLAACCTVVARHLWRYTFRVRERRRRRRGRCPGCGYDRRASAPDARCSECGAAGVGAA